VPKKSNFLQFFSIFCNFSSFFFEKVQKTPIFLKKSSKKVQEIPKKFKKFEFFLIFFNFS